jgi:hypothetical protein
MKQFHIKNHFVPEVYLKNWTKEDGKLEAYRILVPHEKVRLWKPHSPSAIGWQKHLYTRTIAGEENDELEHWFNSAFEYPAEPVIQKVISDQKLTPEDWKTLIRFLAIQDIRTPTSLLNFLKRESELLDTLLKNNIEEVAEKMMSEDFQDHLTSNRHSNINDYDELPLKLSFYHDHEAKTLRINAKTYSGRKSWLFLIKNILQNHLDILTNQKWTILKPAKGLSFFTSDNPVIKLNYRNNENYDLAGTWIKPHSNIILPLSPSHAMFTEVGEKNLPRRGSRLSDYHTNELRSFIADNANRYIFSQYIDSDIERLRPRIINKEHYLNEKNQIETWHERNKELELAYETEKIKVYP